MKKTKIDKWLFWSSILSLFVAAFISQRIGEVELLGVGGMIKNMWFFYLFTPIPCASILYSNKLKKRNLKYLKNMVVGFIVLPLLLIYGSFTFIFSSVFSHDFSRLNSYEVALHVSFPNDGKISTEIIDETTFKSYVVFTDPFQVETFEDEIQLNSYWITELPTNLSSLLDTVGEYELRKCDITIAYNVTDQTYNTYPIINGTYEFLIIGYETMNSRLIIYEFQTVINN